MYQRLDSISDSAPLSLQVTTTLDPEVMQSGFGVNFLFWTGGFLEKCRRISRRILMANLFLEFFSLVSPRLQTPQKIHAQN